MSRKRDQKESQKQIKTLKKVLSYIRHYRLYLVLSVLCAAVSVVLTLYNPILIGDAVDEIVGKGNVNFAAVLSILEKMAVLILLTGAVQWLMNVCNNKISYNVIRDMRQDAFNRIQISAVSVYRQPSIWRGSQQNYRRCGSVLGRSPDGIYPAFYRGDYHCRNTAVYADDQSADYGSGHCSYPTFSAGGCIYRRTYLQYVPKTV